MLVYLLGVATPIAIVAIYLGLAWITFRTHGGYLS